MSFITAMALLVMLILHEGMSVGEQPDRCQCIQHERRRIGRHLGSVKVHAATSHCSRVEIIATVRATGVQVCLDPELPWVKKVLERMRAAEARHVEATTPL